MTHLTQLFPNQRQVTMDDIAQQIAQAKREPLGISAASAHEFCAQLSEKILNDKRAHTFPSLQALGFWLRPTSLKAMLEHHLPTPQGCTRVPRGVVFQIPPSNIETLFGYNCALSLLCGNITLVRLPSQSTPEQDILLDFMAEICAVMPPALTHRLIFLRYAHEAEITQRLSQLCHLRMVWGGDETIGTIRQIPLPPLAHEISFANRFSMGAIKARAFLDQNDDERTATARGFVNDIFQFGQMACASPRLLGWVGEEEETKEAASLFYPQLAAIALEKFGAPETGENLAKLNTQFLALHDLEVGATITYNPALTVMRLRGWQGVAEFKKLNFGHGMLLETRFERLNDLADCAEGMDQTLVVCGFDAPELQSFILQCDGRGFDRIVKSGQALAFDPIWDGTNLFDVLTKFAKVSL